MPSRRHFFGPFAGDYWIIGVNEKNGLSLRTLPAASFDLSREPAMKESLYRKIVSIAVRKGYEAGTSTLPVVDQPLNPALR